MASSIVQVFDGMQADWSPDGTKFAFTDMGHSVRQDTLCTMNIDGTELRVIIYWGLDPKWSPDGSKILCSRMGQLTLIDPSEDYTDDKRKPIKLCDLSVIMGHYAWSPNGKTIAFSSDSGLYLVDLDGSNLRCLTKDDKGDKHWISWSPDGCWLAYCDQGIRAIHVISHFQKIISPHGKYSSWNPVTNKIAFYVDMWFQHSDDAQKLPTGIRIFDFDTSQTETIEIGNAEIARNMMNPLAWSPNGKHLAFQMTTFKLLRKELPAIYTLNIETKNLTQLIEGKHAGDSSLKWSPDGSKIAVCSSPEFFTRILDVE